MNGLGSAETAQLAALLKAGCHAELENRARDLIAQRPEVGLLWQLLAIAEKAQGQDALRALERAAFLLPEDASAHNNLGNAFAERRRWPEAATSLRRAIGLQPELAEPHANLGHVQAELGDWESAAMSYRRALAIAPDAVETLLGLGAAQLELGRFADAVATCRSALALVPGRVDALCNLGEAHRGLGQLDQAINFYRQALDLQPDYGVAHGKLAVALRLQGYPTQAEASCRAALAFDGSQGSILTILAESCADRGDFAEAEVNFRRALSLDPDRPEAWAGLGRQGALRQEEAETLERRVANPMHSARAEAQLRFALGKYFGDGGDAERAFAHYQCANELSKRFTPPYDRQALERSVDRIIASYDRDWINQMRAVGADSERPVLIVGMLRSGTTLTEQILASLPEVLGAGELSFWNDVAAAIAGPTPGATPRPAALASLSRDYLRLLEQRAPDAIRVVDKMPGNFLHLGLIHAALPRARIVHMRRDPIDTCLSIYFQQFEAFHPYANDLDDLAHFYRQYRRLMQHWRATLPDGVLLELDYEELVHAQEASSRRLLQFVGLPWNARCLEFHRTERAVITASKWQVRQKISASSVGRSRQYERFLGPLRQLSDA